jgi:hypothetical protein
MLDGGALEKIVRRIVVLGATGHFGRAAAEQLRELGLPFKTASRRGHVDIRVDANDAASIRSAIDRDDIIVDAAGPFYRRSMTLIETAIDFGFDVVDLNDDLRYAERVIELAPRIESAGIRILSSASTVSAMSAAVIAQSDIERPQKLTAFLVPASRHTANGGAALSLLRSVGGRVRARCDGRLQDFAGWRYPRSFDMPPPVGPVCGRLFESADAVHLPRIWSSLRDVAMYVDTNTAGLNSLLDLAARSAAVRRVMEWGAPWGTRIARVFGSAAGGVGYEIEGTGGQVERYALVAGRNGFITAVAPAILAAQAIAEDRFAHRGLVSPDQHVEPHILFNFLKSKGIELSEGMEE